MKIIALDIGTVRIGVATSDIMEIIASAYESYRRKNIEEDLKHIAQLVSSLNAGLVVIGLPLKMDGTEGQSVEMAKNFGEAGQLRTNLLRNGSLRDIAGGLCYHNDNKKEVRPWKTLQSG